MDVFVERALNRGLVPEGHEVEVVDMGRCRMLDRHLLAQLLARDDAEARQFRPVLGRHAQRRAPQVDDAEIVAAPGDVGLELADARQFKRDVLGRDVGRDVLESRPQHLGAVVGDFRRDRAGRGLEVDDGPPAVAAAHQAERHHRHADRDRSVPAHVGILRAVDIDQPRIELRARRRRQEDAEHVLVAARLAHQRAAQPVVVLLQEAALAEDVQPGRIGDPLWMMQSGSPSVCV